MARPIQDTDITSSLSTFVSSNNDDLSYDLAKTKAISEGEREMDVTVIRKNCDNRTESSRKKKVQNNILDSKESMEETSCLLWVTMFTKVMCSIVEKRNFQLLEQTLSIYIRDILSSTQKNCIKNSDINKLKNHISNTLTFFHFYWYDIKEHISDHSRYLNKLSVLLAIYVNMELKTSKRSKNHFEVAAKILNALWIYLHNSEEHIFKVILRSKLTNGRYAKICNLIFAFYTRRQNKTCSSTMNLRSPEMSTKLSIEV